jgi:2'-5' RNA ligase
VAGEVSDVGPIETAVIVPIPVAEAIVAAHRRRLDPAATWGVPAHVTVVFPFVRYAELDEDVLNRLAEALQPVGAFTCVFARVEWFGDQVVWLAPEPDAPFRQLTRVVWDAFPEYPPYRGAHLDVVPHLTIGGPLPGAPAELRAAEAEVLPKLPFTAVVNQVLVMAGTREPDSWRAIRKVALADRGLPGSS